MVALKPQGNMAIIIRIEFKFSSHYMMVEDGYRRMSDVGTPFEVAQGVTIKERVNVHIMSYLLEDVA